MLLVALRKKGEVGVAHVLLRHYFVRLISWLGDKCLSFGRGTASFRSNLYSPDM